MEPISFIAQIAFFASGIGPSLRMVFSFSLSIIAVRLFTAGVLGRHIPAVWNEFCRLPCKQNYHCWRLI